MVNDTAAILRGKIKKWSKGIVLDGASEEDILEYIQTKGHEYTAGKYVDSDLWELFTINFGTFTAESFALLPPKECIDLRQILRKGGVYVPPPNIVTGKTTAVCLFEVAQELEQHKWTAIDIEIARSDLEDGNMSRLIKLPPKRPPTITPTDTDPQPLTEGESVNNGNQNQITPAPAPNSANTSRQIADISKILTDDQKYDGTSGDSFDHKLAIFLNICQRVELDQDSLCKAFPAMLKGMALDHYFSTQLMDRTYQDCCTHIRNFFEGPSFYRRNLDKWNTVTLASIIAKQPQNTTYECVQLLINELRKLQHGLAPSFQATEFLHNKLIMACQGVPACRYAIADPPSDVGHLINKIQSSITAFEKEQQLSTATGNFIGDTDRDNVDAFFTDRRYHSSRPQGRYDRPPGRFNTNRLFGNSDRGRFGRQDSGNRFSSSSRNRCFVCKKEGCRSWKHTPQEQEEEQARFKARFSSRVDTSSKEFGQRLNQFIAEFEGDDDDDLESAFEAMMTEDTHQDAFFTSIGSLSPQFAFNTTMELANRAFAHELIAESLPTPTSLPHVESTESIESTEPITSYNNSAQSRYDSRQFYGVMIDTGASRKSTAGYGQFQALQRAQPDIQINQATKGMVTIQFGIGSTSSIGSVAIATPIGIVEFHIVKANTPFLLSLADMDSLKVYFNNLTDKLVTPQGNVAVVRRFGHSFLLWDSSLQQFIIESFDSNPCFLTDIELKRLHRRFGHPSVDRLQRVLERSGHDVDRQALQELTKICTHCQHYGRSPGRFRFSLRDDSSFNHSIIVDIMYINNKPVLHVVDEETRYQAGRWLPNISAKTTWDTLRLCWIDTYLGPPDSITTDAGKNFVSKEFSQNATSMGISLKAVPVEAHHSIGIVERYHGPLRRAYQIVTDELPDIDQEQALQMSFKAINDSAGPNGITPTLLVYGAFPRLVNSDPPSATITQRAAVLKKVMAELRVLRAKRQVNDALNTRNGPVTDAIHNLTLDSDVLVWREGNGTQAGSWDGPFKLISMEGEACTLALPHGNTSFRSTSVKPYITASNTQNHTVPDEPQQQEQAVERPYRQRRPPQRNPDEGYGADITIYLADNQSLFETSRKAEIMGLLEKGVFEVVTVDDVPTNTRIFKSRFVDEVKHKDTDKAFYKSRLVVQAYNDNDKTAVLTQSPTLQRVSQRLILCLAAMGINSDDDRQLYLRDISQAYVQSTTELNRDFYIKPPHEIITHLKLTDNKLLRVVKPLYGVPEAGNHWFKTYHSHHIDKLSMEQSTYDPCLLFSNSSNIYGVVGLQTDDTLFFANHKFAELEQIELQKAGFLAKEREQLTPSTPLKFNGGIIKSQDSSISLTQEKQCKNLNLVSDKPADSTSSRGATRGNLSTKEQYIAQRARGAYIASVCQPEATYDLSVAAQSTDFNAENIKSLNKRLQWQIQNAARGIKFVKLDQDSVKLLTFTDASFANNKDFSSQIGYVLVLADGSGKANVLHWSSIKCKRVTRSVLASELYSLAHGFDIGAAIKSTIDKVLRIDIPMVLCTDSRSLYDCIVKLGTTQEKRLMIDLMCLRQAYERREITEVKWIDGNSNPADSMTKIKPSSALRRLIESNTIELQAMEWVERDTHA